MMQIESYTSTPVHLLDELIQVWEKSVRSSHHFLCEADIDFYRPLIREQYFHAVSLYTVRNAQGSIAAFMGLSADLVEMLFVLPEEQGKGYGKALLNYALHHKGIRKVDVNEQNTQAFHFYRHMGYQIIGRNTTDSTGRPFPILHLELTNEI